MDQVCDTWRAGVERIITNLERVKLKLDEAFFYLDEIEELIQEGDFEKRKQLGCRRPGNDWPASSRVGAKVVELKEILVALAAREEEEDGAMNRVVRKRQRSRAGGGAVLGESKKKAVLASIGGSLATFWPGALCFGYPGVLGPYWRETFEVGTADTGNIMFFMLASLGIFMFLVGRWQERLGLRTMVVIGGILCGVNMLTAAYANGMAMVYLWAFVTGAASCFTNMPALTAVQRWFPGRRGLVSSIVNLVFGSAAAIASRLWPACFRGWGICP